MTTAEALAWEADERKRVFYRLVAQGEQGGPFAQSDDDALHALAARVRELEGRTCDTCDNQQVDEGNPKSPWCRYLTTLGGGKRIYCYDVDQGCNAWKKKA